MTSTVYISFYFSSFAGNIWFSSLVSGIFCMSFKRWKLFFSPLRHSAHWWWMAPLITAMCFSLILVQHGSTEWSMVFIRNLWYNNGYNLIFYGASIKHSFFYYPYAVDNLQFDQFSRISHNIIISNVSINEWADLCM